MQYELCLLRNLNILDIVFIRETFYAWSNSFNSWFPLQSLLKPLVNKPNKSKQVTACEKARYFLAVTSKLKCRSFLFFVDQINQFTSKPPKSSTLSPESTILGTTFRTAQMRLTLSEPVSYHFRKFFPWILPCRHTCSCSLRTMADTCRCFYTAGCRMASIMECTWKFKT